MQQVARYKAKYKLQKIFGHYVKEIHQHGGPDHRPLAVDGEDGKDGKNGRPGKNGLDPGDDAEDGSDGEEGGDAQDGKDGGDMKIMIEFKGQSIENKTRTYSIETSAAGMCMCLRIRGEGGNVGEMQMNFSNISS